MTNHRQRTTPGRPRTIVRGLWSIGLIGLLLTVALLVDATPGQTARNPRSTAGSQVAGQLRVVRIRAATPAEAFRLIERGINQFEARDGDDLLVLVTAEQQAALRAAGWDVRLDRTQTSRLRSVQPQTVQTDYRTVEETEQFLRSMAETYPHLATLGDFGDSWERQQLGAPHGYDLLALRLTNQATTGPKPVFFLMAALHARELTTAEIATRFISHLLTGYQVDPDITWLLNEHEIVVVPIANPDGRKLAEQGYSQRKNINNSFGDCIEPPGSGNQYGIDLNRNFAFAWGTVHGPDIFPCSLVYPGPTAASEPETQTLQTFIRSFYPDHPRPGDGTPAPDTTSGVLITLHSYSDLVLWPWGHTTAPAPNAVGLERLGRRMAAFNGYIPGQSVSLYPTSGTTDDWSYAELGIASYTFEIGSYGGTCGGFMPPYGCLDGLGGRNFWEENLPALLYAARVTRAPYSQPAGPDVYAIEVITDTQTLTLTATLDGRDQPVAGGALYLRSGPAQNDTALNLQPVDGAFDTVLERGQIRLPLDQGIGRDIATAAQRDRLLLVQGRNAAGIWGPLSAAWLETNHHYWLPLVETSRLGGKT
ncbi:MAG: M14 family zinc carboxypeptidase [Chloroflexaceae bacterium]